MADVESAVRLCGQPHAKSNETPNRVVDGIGRDPLADWSGTLGRRVPLRCNTRTSLSLAPFLLALVFVVVVVVGKCRNGFNYKNGEPFLLLRDFIRGRGGDFFFLFADNKRDLRFFYSLLLACKPT